RGKRRSNLAAFFVESACGNAALSSVCAQGKDGSGHAADGPGSTLGRSRVGGSRIKRRSHAGLPRTVDRSRIKWRPRAERGHAGNSRMPSPASQRSVARSCALATAQAAASRWRPHRR
ncbi:hypothetical protein GW17_00009455, partial [Ensete ventricosum]